ncbi:hypothetical protein POSPLDRAFT_94833 [Postia placenta Mad-698-R]|nr:hypothetical protein POSPLDRAFT_94833 [Postia placenta Mad-698-R]
MVSVSRLLLSAVAFAAAGVLALPTELSRPAKRAPSAPYWVEYFDASVSEVTGVPPVSDVTVCPMHYFHPRGCPLTLDTRARTHRDTMCCKCRSSRMHRRATDPKACARSSPHSIIAFLLTEGAWDNAEGWASLSASDRSTLKSQYAAAGISLMVSVFGSTDTPTSSGADPTDTANTFAAWVQEYDLDGIDVDYEDFDAFDAGTAEAWLVTFTTQLRNQLPASDYIITHAPVAPWFSPNYWTNGGYIQVDSEVGDLINWYNIQFYNQGSTEYTTCAGLLTNSSSTWPESALFQIAASGVPLDKLVIGKPATTGDASTGYMSTSTLATCVEQAKGQGWDAGVMVWEYPDAGTSWITAVRADSWPVS